MSAAGKRPWPFEDEPPLLFTNQEIRKFGTNPTLVLAYTRQHGEQSSAVIALGTGLSRSQVYRAKRKLDEVPTAAVNTDLLAKARDMHPAAVAPEHCVWCGTTESLVVDHIIPRSRGGSDEGGNLRVLCSPCNSLKGWRLDEEVFPGGIPPVGWSGGPCRF